MTTFDTLKAAILVANDRAKPVNLSSHERDELITLLMAPMIKVDANRGLVQRQTDQNRLLREFCAWMVEYGHPPSKFLPTNGTTWRWFDTFRKWLVANGTAAHEGRGRFRMTVSYPDNEDEEA